MVGKSTSVWYEESNRRDVVRQIRSPSKGGYVLVNLVRCRVKGKFVLVVQYEESSMQDIVRPDRSHTNGGLLLACPV